MSNTMRAVLGVGVVVLAVVLLIVLKDDGREKSSDKGATTVRTESAPNEPKPSIPTIVVKGGKPVGGVQKLEFTKGDVIRFTVRSDVADHVHLHGYDVFKDVPAGGSVTFAVPANLDGLYEVELEDRVEPLAEITVNPS